MALAKQDAAHLTFKRIVAPGAKLIFVMSHILQQRDCILNYKTFVFLCALLSELCGKFNHKVHEDLHNEH